RPAPTLRVSRRSTRTDFETVRPSPFRASNGRATRSRRPATRTWWTGSSCPATAPGNSRKTRVIRSSSSRDERSSRADWAVTGLSPGGRTLPRRLSLASMRPRPPAPPRAPSPRASRDPGHGAVRRVFGSGDIPVTTPESERLSTAVSVPNRPVAVLDLGASAIRLLVAELPPGGSPRILRKGSRAVLLGKDTFGGGRLGAPTIEATLRALEGFRRIMDSYGVVRYRAVATSAVREATNRDTFLDRVRLRAGIEVEVIDGSEENRLTYLAVREALREHEAMTDGD